MLEIWNVLISCSQPVKITCVIFMETNWFQIFKCILNDYWSRSSRKFTHFSPCIFSYSRGVFRTVSTIKVGASCEKSQQFSSKVEPFAKIKPVNYFCKILHLRCLTEFWVHLLFSVDIWELECPHSRLFQRLGVLNSFEATISLILKANQLTTNQIDWFLHERDCCLKWVKSG